MSRNPVPCTSRSCQICKFVKEETEVVVGSYTVKDILDGTVNLPFTNSSAWLEIQDECYDLKRLRQFLQNGTSPGKKSKNLRTVKRYISSRVVISDKGLLVVRNLQPLGPNIDRIVVPQQMLHGILTALHIKLSHPTSHQLTKICRYFFAINLDNAVSKVVKSCSTCNAIKDIPKALVPQSSEPPPDFIGQTFASDIIKRFLQKILVLRECTSSYTVASIINSENKEDVTQGLIELCHLVRPSSLCPITVRIDPAPAHRSFHFGSSLKSQNIHIEIGDSLNQNKNPIAEKAVRELIRELLILQPEGNSVNQRILSQAVANLNSRIRYSGLSAYELFTHKEQSTGFRLNINDLDIIKKQHENRIRNHPYSEVSKSNGKPPFPKPNISVGSLVYLHKEGSKLHARPRYIVISISNGKCQIKRLTPTKLSYNTFSIKIEECYPVCSEIDEIELPTDDPPLDYNEPENPQLGVKRPYLDPHAEIFPCKSCGNEVKDLDPAIQCHHCNQWCHTACCDVTKDQYERLKEEEEESEWYCPEHQYLNTAQNNVEPTLLDEAGLDESTSQEDLSDSLWEEPPEEVPVIHDPEQATRHSSRTRKPPERLIL